MLLFSTVCVGRSVSVLSKAAQDATADRFRSGSGDRLTSRCCREITLAVLFEPLPERYPAGSPCPVPFQTQKAAPKDGLDITIFAGLLVDDRLDRRLVGHRGVAAAEDIAGADSGLVAIETLVTARAATLCEPEHVATRDMAEAIPHIRL